MALSDLPALRLTNLSPQSLLDEMVAAVPNLTGKWTDLSPSDPGVTLLELLSWTIDKLLFYQDKRVNEAFLIRAREMKNVIAHAQAIGYRHHGIVSSTTLIRFSLDTPATARIVIPQYTRVCVSSGVDQVVFFATTQKATINVGETTVLVGARQGVLRTETFRTTGTPSQSFLLSSQIADQESIQVIVDHVVWEQVDTFVASQAEDRDFVVNIDYLGNTSITLGDGFFGQVPPTSATDNVTVTYLESLGSNGNVGTNVVTTLLDVIADVNFQTVSLHVTNPEAATGGQDRETIEHIKRQAPAELSALFRAMTKADFIALSEGFPGVAKANSWGEQETSPPEYRMMNWVLNVIAPESVTREDLIADYVHNGLPSSQLKTDLLDYLHNKACITTRIKIMDPVYIPVQVTANVYFEKGALSSEVKAAVEDSLLEFFEFSSVEFGQDIRQSTVFRLLDQVPGVAYVVLNSFKRVDRPLDPAIADTIVCKQYELPFLHTLTLVMGPDTQVPPPSDIYPSPPPAQAPVD